MSKNLATTTVATAPSPATSGTTLTVATGTGSRLFDGMAVLHPAGAVPTAANAEVVSITVAGDVVTLTRAQESSTARTVVVGDILTQGITAAMWDTLVASNAGKAAAVHAHSASDVTSGTLPLTRGGTGGTDAATARTALGLGSAATMTPATIAADPVMTGTYVPLAGASAGKVPVATSGSAVSWQAPSVLPGPLEKTPIYVYGHSYMSGVGTSGGRDIVSRLTQRTGTAVTNRSGSGASITNRFQQMWTTGTGNTWTPGTQGVVVWDTMTNDSIRSDSPTASWTPDMTSGYRAYLTGLIHLFRAKAWAYYTDATVTRTGFAGVFGNACFSTNTADLISISVASTITKVGLVIFRATPSDPPGGEYRVNGGAWTPFPAVAIDLTWNGAPHIIEVTVPGGSTSTIEIRPESGKRTRFYGWIDMGNLTPPSFVIVKDFKPDAVGSSNSAAVTLTAPQQALVHASFDAAWSAVDAVVADQALNADSTIVAADPATGFDNTSAWVSSDRLHPNAVGHWVYANAIQTACARLAMRVGLTPA